MAKKPQDKQKERLFKEKLVPTKPGSGELFDVSFDDDSGPVECLGKTFENDHARREYFLEKLREKLKDPEFRKIEGFPISEDEDILALSDPPYYTACPNPFLDAFISTHSTPYDAGTDDYQREPFTSDVTEGKQDPVCMAHTYHTKVPYRAIARYILHYTKPGDVILDSFAGTGMTGVAAQLCANPDTTFQQTVDQEWKTNGEEPPTWGPRYAVLCDISPFATFLARGFNSDLSVHEFDSESRQLLADCEDELGWLYETDTTSGNNGRVSYILWAELFFCECGAEVPFWMIDDPNDLPSGPTSQLRCPKCSSLFEKSSAQRVVTTFGDDLLGHPVTQTKQMMILIQTIRSGNSLKTLPTKFDTALLDKIASEPFTHFVPNQQMMFREGAWGDMHRAGYHTGITHTHHFWTKRNLLVLSDLFSRAFDSANRHEMLFTCTSFAVKTGSRMHSVGFKNERINLAGQTYNTLQLTSLSAERNLFILGEGKIDDLKCVFEMTKDLSNVAISTQSATSLFAVADNSIDYVFIDPPFGKNIIYCELNFLYEAWLRVFTNTTLEAIVSTTYGKSLGKYQSLMHDSFSEAYCALKPGRWMTVAFHNSKNSVWNAIQEALGMAGFVVADVRVLDKGQGTYKQMTTQGAVKEDLVISAYKPSFALEEKFTLEAGTQDGVWEFVSSHLQQLPLIVTLDNCGEVVSERRRFLLFDRMVAFHIQRGVTVPMSAAEFYEGLYERYPERDAMYFTPDQVVEYDKERMKCDEFRQLELFVSDEVSAIHWLRQQLQKKPSTRQELHATFVQELSGWQKHEEQPELLELLEGNFLCYEGTGEVPSQIHTYLSSNYHDLRKVTKDDPMLVRKAKDRWYVPDPRKVPDLEKVRHRALMREFRKYQEGTKRLTKIRTEAIRAGFQESYRNQDYGAIIAMAKRIKRSVIEEDPALLMYYDNALMRTEG